MKHKSKTDDRCPCCSGETFAACCGPFLAKEATPERAEQLMRSRYTAYTREDAPYLTRTWHPTTRRHNLDFDPAIKWIGLKVVRCERGEADDDRGVVEYVARYKQGGRAERLHEIARFRKRDGRWVYLDGELI